MPTEVGARVVAIRNGDETTMYVYGRGTYLGEQQIPFWNPDAPSSFGHTWRDEAEQIVRHHMSQPQEEWIYNGKPMGVDLYGNPLGDTRTFEQRVADYLAGMARNPCIELDNGQRVWGYFCWWGPEDQYERARGDRAEVIVPVPDPLPRHLLVADAAAT